MSENVRTGALKYLGLLIERRVFIAAVTIATFIVAAIAELTLLKNDFAAEVILVQTSPELGSEKMTRLIPSAYHTKAYEELVRSMTVLGAVLDDAVSAGVWENEGDMPELDTFRGQLRTRTIVIDQTSRPVNYAPFMTLQVTDADPEVARKLADLWAKRAIEAANRSNELSVDTATETLSTQESAYREQLDTIWGEQAIEEAKWNLPILGVELNNLVKLIDSVHEQLLNAQAQIAAQRERLQSIQAQLADEDEFHFLWRAPSDDVYWLEELNGGTQSGAPAGTLDELKGKGLMHQQANLVYQTLAEDKNEAVAALAAAEATSTALEAQLTRLNEERMVLQSTIAEHDLVQKRLTRQASVVNEIYTEIADLNAFVLAASELVRPREADETLPVGFNRLSESTYVQETRGLTTGRTRVAIVTLVAMLLAVIYVIGSAEWSHWIGHSRAASVETKTDE